MPVVFPIKIQPGRLPEELVFAAHAAQPIAIDLTPKLHWLKHSFSYLVGAVWALTPWHGLQ